MTPTKERAILRERWVNHLIEYFDKLGEDIQRAKSNEIAFPVVSENENEYYIKIVVSVPTGSRDGDGYNPYDLAEEYQLKLENKRLKEEKKKKEKKG